MGFIAASTISNVTNLNNSNQTVTPTTTTLNADLAGLVKNNSTNVANVANQTTTAATTQAKAVTKVANNIVSKGINTVTSSLGSGLNLVESGIGSIAKSVSSVLSGTFHTSKDATASVTNKNNPDPLKTSTVGGVPQSKTFFLNNQFSQATPVNLQTEKSQTDTGINSSINTLTSRFGLATSTATSGLNNATKSLTQNSFVNGLYSTSQAAKSTIATTIATTSKTVGGVVTTLTSAQNDFINSYSGVVSKLAGASDDATLASLVDPSLIGTADANGYAIAGVPTDVSTDKLDSIYGLAKSIGCSIVDAKYTDFGALSALKSLLLNLASELNMTNLLNQILNCDRFQDANSISNMMQMFYNNASSNAAVANIAATAVNDPSKTAVSTNLAKSIVTNSNLTTDDTSNVTSIFNQMKVKGSNVYGVDTGSSTMVYDLDTVGKSPSYITDAVLGDSSVSDVLNGRLLAVA